MATKTQAEEIFEYATLGLREGMFIVDLTDLDFMDCTGIHLLVRAAADARDQGARVRIRVRQSGPVRRVLDILGPGTGLDRMLESPPASSNGGPHR